ncbi:MAG: hypothetical protein ACT452_02970 [Microthrixaceae bacterium]
MTALFEEPERAKVATALDEQVPRASALGAVDYVERLLTALDHDPPRLWAAPGSWAGTSTGGWIELGPWERHAWGQRLEDLHAVYRRVLADEPAPGDARVLHAHACEATYGDPAYGGNQASAGWQRISFPEPLFPPARGAS